MSLPGHVHSQYQMIYSHFVKTLYAGNEFIRTANNDSLLELLHNFLEVHTFRVHGVSFLVEPTNGAPTEIIVGEQGEPAHDPFG